ncbi:hypothetical protein HDV62DRAFT_30708 [Trichoderma sp. SZMC 28011]
MLVRCGGCSPCFLLRAFGGSKRSARYLCIYFPCSPYHRVQAVPPLTIRGLCVTHHSANDVFILITGNGRWGITCASKLSSLHQCWDRW